MRILFVLSYYHPYIGGHETLFQRLAEGLAARGHAVRVITTRLKATPGLQILNGVTIERIATPPMADRYFLTFLALPAALRAARTVDVVHTSPYNGAPPGFAAARLAGKPVVFTALEVLGARWHAVEPNPLTSRVYRTIEWFVTRLPYDRIAAISQATLRDAIGQGVDPARGTVAYPGVDRPAGLDPADSPLRGLIRADRNEFIFVYFGRPGITKGVDVLLDAAPLVRREIPQAHLVLILADEPRAQYLARMRQIAGITRQDGRARITVLPSFARRDELFAALSGAGCIVIPSRTEGFGLTAAEACALGRPVVATRAGSLPEVVSGRHVLVEPGDAQSLADGMVRAARGEFDYTPPRDFSWDRMVDEYLKIYEELLK